MLHWPLNLECEWIFISEALSNLPEQQEASAFRLPTSLVGGTTDIGRADGSDKLHGPLLLHAEI